MNILRTWNSGISRRTMLASVVLLLLTHCGGGGGGGGGAPSGTDASLSSLTLSQSTLSPAFNPSVLAYTSDVADSVPFITATPTAAATGATIKVNGASVASASASGSIGLLAGDNPITIIVTAADALTTRTYTVTVTATDSSSTPQLRYRFDGDSSNTGFLSGFTLNASGSSFVAGRIGQAIHFGSAGFAQVSGMRSVLGAFGPATVSFWMKEDAPLPGQAFWDDSNRNSAPFGGVQLGESAGITSVCVASTTNGFLGGSCLGFSAPSIAVWHHWIIRYLGTGAGAGQGGPVEIYVDDVLVHTRANDADNNPVFNNTGMPDTMSLGGIGVTMDDLRIYRRTFTQAEQCTIIIGGVWTGTACTLP